MTYGLNPAQLRQFVIDPSLKTIGLYSRVASDLVLGTAMHESMLQYLHQLRSSPALGLWQMEPATHDDCWTNFLQYHPGLATDVSSLSGGKHSPDLLIGNLYYASAMCRVRYFRSSESLPATSYPLLLAQYWKSIYNTPQGAGTVQQALQQFADAVNTQ